MKKQKLLMVTIYQLLSRFDKKTGEEIECCDMGPVASFKAKTELELLEIMAQNDFNITYHVEDNHYQLQTKTVEGYNESYEESAYFEMIETVEHELKSSIQEQNKIFKKYN